MVLSKRRCSFFKVVIIVWWATRYRIRKLFTDVRMSKSLISWKPQLSVHTNQRIWSWIEGIVPVQCETSSFLPLLMMNAINFSCTNFFFIVINLASFYFPLRKKTKYKSKQKDFHIIPNFPRYEGIMQIEKIFLILNFIISFCNPS